MRGNDEINYLEFTRKHSPGRLVTLVDGLRLLALLDLEFQLVDGARDRSLHGAQLVVQASQQLQRVAVRFKRLRDRLGRRLTTHCSSFLVGSCDRFGRRLVRLVDNALRAILGCLNQFMDRDLLLRIHPRLLRKDGRLFLRLLEQPLSLFQQSLGLIGRGRSGHAQPVNQVEQLLSVNSPARTEPAAPSGEDGVLDLVNQFKEVDVDLLPRRPPVSTLAQAVETGSPDRLRAVADRSARSGPR